MAKFNKPKLHVQHYQISTSDQINGIIDEIKDKYGIHNLTPKGAPLKMQGNHKILTLMFLNRSDIVIRLSGPAFIIEDIFTVWFSKYFD